ncbi:bifunctional 4-hydroxy-2-oxoglutarate aldolase/2-dehydro-3-deoxy-phosphogluconate aldolase [Arthrobacter sp. MI7-26]|uniref:bifunctional 4-hydroxy-2-oxoglutarate aldolase/2-dehydro-3-deoxy-phosphogluconate aldolase n=1 Tax=Arthrobacter sp. MI7-26 TaxID=2993653 RepID=UPI0022493751|nr:bifunctional 4-hydroxy-2-oxoglutarate aldolase/2-dehydro-3-deoxy-phosphogluconate aldolase [Arthrobacter sp. MI7-26]MCX2748741.1 bifunctional 4-hydroxy-2-oxoglutarate aldolase/2-dehydro-3-deoxy-phosphogluconate aldolase [Arthrobacter sp. MI7-26]
MTNFDPILPVVVLDSAASAEMLGAALVAAGIRQAEVTLRTPAALDALRILARTPGLRVGAGTVLEEAQVDDAVDAGAVFVVSPGLDGSVLAAARRRGVSAVPGIATATELMRARTLGVRTVKFFPAEPLGGPGAVKALASVFPDVSFIATGGIGPQRAREYLVLPSVIAIGGSWMVPQETIAAGDFAAVERLCREALVPG